MSETAMTTNWAVRVSDSVDADVRGFVAEHGGDEDDLSGFVEEAVRWRMLERTVGEARAVFADLPPDELHSMSDEAITFARETSPSR